jgi:hypothetical protein
VSFAAITLCAVSQRVFIFVVDCFVIDSGNFCIQPRAVYHWVSEMCLFTETVSRIKINYRIKFNLVV